MINMTRISRLNPAPLNVLLACIAIESSATSQAALIASDSFATQAGGAPSYYVEGSLDSGTAQNPTVGVSGFSGAWDAINGSTAAVQAQDSISLTHAMSPGTALAGSIRGYYMAGTVARRVSRALTSAPAVDGTYYMSVLLKKTATSGGNLYAGLGPSESYTLAFASSGATLIGLDGGAISFYSGGSTTTLLGSGSVAVNKTYLALLKFDYSTTGADSVTVTLYDGSSVQQASQTFSGLNLNMSYLTLAVTSYSPTEAIDEFRFGSQLSDVISDSIAITAADTYILPFGETSISNAASVLDNDLFATSALLVSNVTSGTLTFNSDGSFDYTASGEGISSFYYSAVNATGTSTGTPEKVTLITTLSTDVLTANDDVYTLSPDITNIVIAALGVLTNDSSVNGNTPLYAMMETDVSSGSLTLNTDGGLSYTAAPGFYGTNTFTYKAYSVGGTSDVATVTLITAPPPEVPSDPKKLHIYLLIGQSNMAGRAPYTTEESGIIPGCFLLNDTDIWEPAKLPLNKYSTVRKELSLQKMNPGYGFSKTMIASNSAISLGLVVNAIGGTSITTWERGDTYYEEAIRRTKIAQTNATLKGILWHQGESDSTDDQYLEKLTNLVANLRSDLGEPNLPFVAGEIARNQDPRVNVQINQLPGVVPFTGVASSEGLTLVDSVHFDARSQKLIGQRYAAEMQRIQAVQSIPPAVSEIQYRKGSVTMGLTNLISNATINILQSSSLTPPNWSTSATFNASTATTNWTDSATEPTMFYKTEWK